MDYELYRDYRRFCRDWVRKRHGHVVTGYIETVGLLNKKVNKGA